MLRALPLSALSLLAACGGTARGGSTDAPSASDAATTPDDTTLDSGSAYPTPPAAPVADWYAIDARLELVAGEVRLGRNTSFRVTLVDATLATICEHDVEITAAEVATPLAGEPAELGWWRLDLADGVPDREPCPAWTSRDLRLGVGAYDSRLDPALAAAESPTDPTPYEDALYGMYVQEFDGGPLYVVGVVTMPGLLEADLVAAPPLTDGTYEAHSLVLLASTGG